VTARARLATLAALFAPGSASSLLARLDRASASAALAHAVRLAAAPRAERLAALAAALANDGDFRARAAAAASRERPALAARLRRLGEGLPPEEIASPALRRLCRERLGR
jgi:hypothetical protein